MMTTLFPYVKRVPEDETSKIIKIPDDIRLSLIFEEFSNLTKTISHFLSDDDSSDSSGEESAFSEPTSWNLDQFIPRATTVKNEEHTNSSASSTLTLQPTPQIPPTQITTPIPTTANSNFMVQIDLSKLKRIPQLRNESTPSPPSQSVHLQQQQPPKIQVKVEPQAQPSIQTQPILQSQPQPQTQLLSANQYQVQNSARTPTPTPTPTATPTPTPISVSTIPPTLKKAKELKREADLEPDKTKQSIKYLESSMNFVLHANELETQKVSHKIFTSIYQETIPLLKHVLKLSQPPRDKFNEDKQFMTNLKLYTLALRCLSLLHMKLYKLRERDVIENLRHINAHQKNSPLDQTDNKQITPYLFRQVYNYNFLKYAVDCWQQADQLCDEHPSVKLFFSTIESNCGSLVLATSFHKLMDHVQCGLKLLRSN